MAEMHRPSTLPDALDIRASGALVFAGGTDLMVKRRAGAGVLPDFPGPVLFLDGIPELRGTAQRGGEIEIRAMTTLSEIACTPDVPELLRRIVLDMGGPALRNAATLGGNICNASPAGDTLPFLYAWEADVVLSSLGDGGRVVERRLPIGDFITGPGRTALGPREILIAVRVPSLRPAVFHWRKVGTRKANALTKVSIAAGAELAAGRVSKARIALGAAAPTVVRLTEVERMLEGSTREERVSTSFMERARDLLEAAVRPIDDQRSSSLYRKVTAGNLLCDFIESI